MGAGVVAADVILAYRAFGSVGSAGSPFKFVNGANYATASAQGFQLDTYANAAQTSVTVAVNGADGAASTYTLDTLAFQTVVATTVAWTLNVAVSSALVATGVNAAYVSYCTAAPTGVADTGPALASGIDGNGNPWAIYAPTCAGTQVNLPITAVGSGASIIVASGTGAGVTVLYFSFLLAVTNTGASTTTPATITVLAVA